MLQNVFARISINLKSKTVQISLELLYCLSPNKNRTRQTLNEKTSDANVEISKVKNIMKASSEKANIIRITFKFAGFVNRSETVVEYMSSSIETQHLYKYFHCFHAHLPFGLIFCKQRKYFTRLVCLRSQATSVLSKMTSNSMIGLIQF